MKQPDLNPILSDDEVALLDFRADRPRWGNTTVVCLAAGVPASGATAPGMRERWRRPYRRYEIDVAHHPIQYSVALPAAEEAFRFRAIMYMTWAVHDPVCVARLNVRDAKAVFWPFLGQRLRMLSRRFSIEDSALAEAEINNDLKAAPFNLEAGISVAACAVHLGLDERAEAHLAGRTEARRTRERELADHDLRLLRERHEADQAELHHRLEQLEAEHHLELKKQRVEFYHHALQQDRIGILVLQLIEHPEDISTVVALLDQRHDNSFRKAREVINDLLKADMYNPADLDDIREKTLRRLWEALDTGDTQPSRRLDDHGESERSR
jgi:thioredoxin-like negative regulator of GroEL